MSGYPATFFLSTRNAMRTKLLLALALLCLPLSITGCDSSSNTVGEGNKEPPPDVKAANEARDKAYAEMMQKAQANPTPSPDQQQ
jgi:hypothetical protein